MPPRVLFKTRGGVKSVAWLRSITNYCRCAAVQGQKDMLSGDDDSFRRALGRDCDNDEQREESEGWLVKTKRTVFDWSIICRINCRPLRPD